MTATVHAIKPKPSPAIDIDDELIVARIQLYRLLKQQKHLDEGGDLPLVAIEVHDDGTTKKIYRRPDFVQRMCELVDVIAKLELASAGINYTKE